MQKAQEKVSPTADRSHEVPLDLQRGSLAAEESSQQADNDSDQTVENQVRVILGTVERGERQNSHDWVCGDAESRAWRASQRPDLVMSAVWLAGERPNLFQDVEIHQRLSIARESIFIFTERRSQQRITPTM